MVRAGMLGCKTPVQSGLLKIITLSSRQVNASGLAFVLDAQQALPIKIGVAAWLDAWNRLSPFVQTAAWRLLRLQKFEERERRSVSRWGAHAVRLKRSFVAQQRVIDRAPRWFVGRHRHVPMLVKFNLI